MAPQGARNKKPADYDFPEGCQVQFEFRVLDLFEELARLDPLRQRMQDDYFRLKDSLGRKVNRVDILEGSDIPAREFLKDGWLGFLNGMGELEAEERLWQNTPAEDFLRELEKTSMTRAYKIPTILALLKRGQIVKQVPLSEVGERFMSFYQDHPLHQQDLRDKSKRNWQTWGLDKFTALARRNPVHFLSRGVFSTMTRSTRCFTWQMSWIYSSA